MKAKKSRNRPAPAEARRLRAASALATDLLEEYLAAPGQKRRARRYVRAGATVVVRGDVRIVVVAPGSRGSAGAGPTREVVAARLLVDFGPGSPGPGGDAWPGFCAARLGGLVDWDELADRLLRRFVPSYAAARPNTA